MKKLILSAVAVLALASCTKESYNHAFSFVRPNGTSALPVYADQTLDSVAFWTTDSYSLESNTAWLKLDDKMSSGKIDNVYGYIWGVVVPFTCEPNTTGETRTTKLTLSVYGADEWQQQGTVMIGQFGWHNVERPRPVYDKEYTVATFTAQDSAKQETDTLEFKVNDYWELSDGAFVHPVERQGTKDMHKVVLNIDPNDTGAERKDAIVLSTNQGKVKTTIQFVQSAK
ncbi:MAG: hypothetical protein HUK02_02300 [Bacteroidaceae bacterium]|nr:hypothetical protein [Bacteroidaceae bacterium]